VRSVLSVIIILGIAGLIVGYFIFARESPGHYIPLAILFGANPQGLGGFLHGIVDRTALNLPGIRQNIIISGIVGAAVGLVISFAGRGRSRRR